MLKNRKNKKKKGFTLIELVIVLAVMAIIALIAIPNFTAIRDNSKTKADERSREVIERTMLMLVSDETILDSGKYTVTFENKTIKNVVASELPSPLPSGITATSLQTEVKKALNDVKVPQAKEHQSATAANTGYTITITAGEVNVAYTA
ncbi:prepilin-type N-terminal cleavage/methylation domain-containing protein [Clostridium sp.]|uniref:prepilin-type N-terminal cleavage/methylation domain-containing protein n=1 Tax=Clostridium sp. TaxID=1506 RepID=UPI003992E114